MKHFKHFALTVLVAVASSITAFAYDFERNGIYYRYDYDNSVYVTYMSENDCGYYQQIINIPSTVWHDSKYVQVKGIEGNAFRNCSSVKQININYENYYSWYYITISAFKGCYNLESINIDLKRHRDVYYSSIDGVLVRNDEKINLYYVPNKKGTEYIIPDTIECIGGSAFQDCKDLTKLVIGEDVNDINSGAFSGCTGLKAFFVSEANKYFTRYDDVLMKKDKTEIVAYPNKRSPVYTTPDCVKKIRDNAFDGCFSLSELTISESVDSVGKLNGCDNLKQLTCLSETPPYCAGLGNLVKNGCKLIVPASALLNYKKTAPWYDFFRVTEVAAYPRSNGFIVAWNAVENAIGYEVQYKPYYSKISDEDIDWANAQSKICSKNETETVIQDLISSCLYYIRVRALVEASDYSEWSDAFTKRTGYKANIPIISTSESGLYGRNGNHAVIIWNKVDGAVKYELKVIPSKLFKNGKLDSWYQSDVAIIDTLITGTSLFLKDLPYSTAYYISVRSIMNNGEVSEWYYNTAYLDYYHCFSISTNYRYPVPNVIQQDKSKLANNTITIKLNRNLSYFREIGDPNVDSYINQPEFNIDADGNFDFQYLEVKPSSENPDANIGDGWKVDTAHPYGHKITAEEFANGEIVITGLDANSFYLVDVRNRNRSDLSEYDNLFNTVTALTDGVPEEPILLKHDELIAKYTSANVKDYEIKRSEVYALAENFNAAPISPSLFNTQNAEGQVFLLEGGKTYYLDGNDGIYKGFTLRTNPEDVKAGKRAKVICGIGSNSQIYSGTNGDQWQGVYNMFTLGLPTESANGGELYMKKVAFYDIDFDNPIALNYGDNQAGAGTIAGNYFFNMYSDGMAVTLDSLVIDNCTFKRLVRGFIREQGINYKKWNHVLIHNNQFFDCGYYNNGAGGYCWIAGSGNNTSSNLYNDMKVTENTFFDSPFPSFFSEEKEISWEPGIKWNITFSNNTLINFNTRANGAIIKMRNLPDGSVYNVKNNLIVLCKKDGDQRVLAQWGADIRNTLVKADGTPGKVTLNFENNYSTNTNLTDGQIFSGNAWTSTSNNFGKLVKNGDAILNGTLEVINAGISPEELMISPNPPHIALSASDQNMHRADALDGSAGLEHGVNLYFNCNVKVLNNVIFTKQIGAARWRDLNVSLGVDNHIAPKSSMSDDRVYTAFGQYVGNGIETLKKQPSGLYIINGKKFVVK